MKKLLSAKAISIYVLLATLFIILLPGTFLTDMLRGFAYQILIFALFVSVIFFLRKKWTAFSFVSISIIMLFAILPIEYFRIDRFETGKSDIRVSHFNVFKFNNKYDSLIDVALKTNSDFISFQEVDYKWADSLTTRLKDKYPHSNVFPTNGCYGLAVFSRYPISNSTVFIAGEVPNICGDINLPKGKVHFVASHVRNPLPYDNYVQRNKQIKYLENYVNSIDYPVITLGDYNAVPWDVALEDFKSKTKLKDSRKSFAATYPSWTKLAIIPIDYIFHSNEIECLGFDVIKNTTSDHFGIVGDYKIKNEKLATNKTL